MSMVAWGKWMGRNCYYRRHCSSGTSISKSSTTRPVNRNLQQSTTLLDESEQQALKRIGRLKKYKKDYPACCLVDHPNNVQALMSRSDIANILTDCLKGVTTKSGIPARTPRYQVLNGGYAGYGYGVGSESESSSLLTRSSTQSQSYLKYRYPLIVKPLTAAPRAPRSRQSPQQRSEPPPGIFQPRRTLVQSVCAGG